MNLMSSIAKTLVGIDHRERESRAYAGERKHRVLLRYFLRNQSEDRVVNLEEVEIDRGNAVLPREDSRNHVVGDQTQLDQVEAEPAAVFTLIIERLAQVLRAD